MVDELVALGGRALLTCSPEGPQLGADTVLDLADVDQPARRLAAG